VTQVTINPVCQVSRCVGSALTCLGVPQTGELGPASFAAVVARLLDPRPPKAGREPSPTVTNYEALRPSALSPKVGGEIKGPRGYFRRRGPRPRPQGAGLRVAHCAPGVAAVIFEDRS